MTKNIERSRNIYYMIINEGQYIVKNVYLFFVKLHSSKYYKKEKINALGKQQKVIRKIGRFINPLLWKLV